MLPKPNGGGLEPGQHLWDQEAIEVAWRLRVVLLLAVVSIAVGAWAALP